MDTLIPLIVFLVIIISIIRNVMAKFRDMTGQGGEELSPEEKALQRELQRRLMGKEVVEGEDIEAPVEPERPVRRPHIQPSSARPAPAAPQFQPSEPKDSPPLATRPKVIQAKPVMAPASPIQPAPQSGRADRHVQARKPRAAAKPKTIDSSRIESRRRRRLRLNPKVMGKVVLLSEILRPPLALRGSSDPWERR